MFQLLVKLSLFLCLLVCASAVSNEAGANKLFARQTSNGIKQLPMPIPMPMLEPLLKPSPKDYENLYTAIATEFAPTVKMAKYLRFSLYEVLTTSVGETGCPSRSYYIIEPNYLRTFVNIKFKELDFSRRGNIYHVTRS
jgi:hypothetical protein